MLKNRIDSKLDAEIVFLLGELEKHRDDPEKYADTVKRISELEKLKSDGLKPPSSDVILAVAANIFGILYLARYERTEVIKAPHAFRQIWKVK
jgi:hypothetical protein